MDEKKEGRGNPNMDKEIQICEATYSNKNYF